MTLLAWAASGRPVHRAATADRWSWLDVRLVPAALTVWVLTLLTPLAAPAVLAGTSLAAALAALGVLAGRRTRHGRRAAAVSLVLAATTVTCGLGAVRLAGMESSALHGFAGAPVALELELDTDGQVLPVRRPARGCPALPGRST